MEIDPNVPHFSEWLLGGPGEGSALLMFGGVVLVVGLLALAIAWLTATFRYGPVRGMRAVGEGLAGGLGDLLRISPRRIYGLAWLAAREAMRRRIWVVLVVFGLILMFAEWFLNPDSDSPAELYLNFVLSSTTFLLLLLALFVSVFSLPGDIKNKTIYTIATKPVRSSEIVLGRFVGFAAVGTLFLLVMAVSSYVFVDRALHHTHEVTDIDLRAEREGGPDPVRYVGLTTDNENHRHSVTIHLADFSPGLSVAPPDAEGNVAIDYVGFAAEKAGIHVGDRLLAIDGTPLAEIDTIEDRLLGEAGSQLKLTIERGGQSAEHELTRMVANFETGAKRDHTHAVTALWEDGAIRYEVGPEQGMLNARVPIWGDLSFRNLQGEVEDKGINVGKMWTYRSYIRGNTLAAAVWNFDNIREQDYPHGLPVDLTISVFRGHKGDITQRVMGSYALRNPDHPEIASSETPFESHEFHLDRINIPRQLSDKQGQPLDLFDDLVTEDGRVELWIQCINPGQYFGMAQADVYIRAPDASYTLNFIKGYVGIWLQMVMVIAMGVLFSTFLSGPVGMILTLSAIVMGLFTQDIGNMTLSVVDPERSAQEVASIDRYYGGGPLEALVRIVTQKNLTVELDMNETLEEIIKNIDIGVMWSMEKVLYVLPDLSQFDNVGRLAHGFVIWPDALLQQAVTALAFILCSFVAGCFILRSRELAA